MPERVTQSRREYRIQHFAKACETCVNRDAIKEPITHGDKGKERIDICRLDHQQISPGQGVCAAWRTRT
jgi:hypothetical protein